ncbi:MAG: 2OG-Fe(II) oxygenase [Flavobacterium sp.]|nr:2OG-Fe(II) oxygenase [Flavobacterium sp.]
MEIAFETLIASYLEDNIGIVTEFISDDLAQHLRQNLVKLEDQKLLLAAGTGNETKFVRNKKVRSDVIYWLDKSHNNVYETAFLIHIEAFIQYLNESCYAGITSYEFHYSLYEKGSFYQKHVDQFQDNSSRAFSMICYLNENWKVEDGGELRIHQFNSNQHISPTQGKTVFFKSDELEHEVLITNKRRMSVTGWLKREERF